MAELTSKDLERVYNEKYMQLYYLAYDYVGEEEACRDIVSEVFVNVWHSRQKIAMATLSSYLYVSVKNRALDYLRKQQKRNAFEKEYLQAAEEYDTDDWEAREDRIRQLHQEIRNMPERTREILKERFFNDRSNAEVAEQFGMTVAGIKKTITRAFAQLRGKIK